MSRSHLVLTGLSLSLLASAIAAGLSGCDSGDGPPIGTVAITPTGCTLAAGAAQPKTAPNGYWVNGNTVCTPQGKPHLLHGVDRPSLEWAVTGQNLSAADFASMATWHANVVRVALDQDFWLEDSPHYAATYAPLVDQVVQWAELAGIDVILDLHWSDQGDYTVTPGQQTMADTHSLQFWKEVAARYKGDGRVFFELYNEPHDVSPAVWLSGGQAGFTVVGMQQLHDAVRAAGADNLVIVGGLDWAFDLSQVQDYPVVGYNILYATHPYNTADRQPGTWYLKWGYLAATSPVVATEFGDGTGSCSPTWDQELISYADQNHVSWTAWAWWAGGCTFPSLLTNWTGGTTNEGAVVKGALLGYDDPAAPSPGGDGHDAGEGSEASTTDGGDALTGDDGGDAGDAGE
jgi:endoglucanase